MIQGIFSTAEQARQFAMAGNATITLRSKATGARFTYKIQAPHVPGNEGTNAARDLSQGVFFVKVLTGADNENSYSYLGHIRRGIFFHGGTKARIGRDAPSAKAFAWAWKSFQQDAIPSQLEVWHEGRCGRCARKLTVPSSIASGFGPECINYAPGVFLATEVA
jgi:hypothetical protein